LCVILILEALIHSHWKFKYFNFLSKYKGEAYVTNDDSAEKRTVGNLWAELSQGNCLFIMAVEQDKDGRDVRQQILSLIA
jgi:hypothetical protein